MKNNEGNKKYNIVFCSDNGYAMQLCIAVYSTIKNFSKKEDLNIFVLDAGISDINKKRILDSCAIFNVGINFKQIDCSPFKKHKVKQYNEYAFARLFVENIFSNLDKILYLDSDIVVDGDLKNLMEVNINEYSAGVVPYEFTLSDNELNTTYKHIGVDNPLFNSGVMLINLNRWRKNKVLEKSYKFYDKHRSNLLFADQDILNNLLHDSVLILPAKYNVNNRILYSHFFQEMIYDKEEYLEAKTYPIVIHFAGWSRPRNGDCFHKGNKIWRNYLKETKFKGWKLPIKKYYTTKRFKIFMGKIISDFVSLFGYHIYEVFLSFWRKFLV